MRGGAGGNRLVQDLLDEHLTSEQRAALWSFLVVKTVIEPGKASRETLHGSRPRPYAWRATPTHSAHR